MPTQSVNRAEWTVRWQDRDPRIQREVKSQLFRETWSQIDPERANKELLEEKHRLSLAQVPNRKF